MSHKGTQIELHSLIDDFRYYMPNGVANVKPKSAKYCAFATTGRYDSNKGSTSVKPVLNNRDWNRREEENGKKGCICGEAHKWRNC